MTEKSLTKNIPVEKQGNMKLIQAITLIALLLLWVGYGFALYNGNKTNMAGYAILILPFSLINLKVLFTREKAQNTVLNIIAKLDGILLLVCAIITIVSVLVK
ncbi:MAG: hypothetical protein PHE06_12305 [Lachnospiraceae bacterium]|nr:hypothetical protein [Lachnospiraceae bacterium]MDD3796721.1 hypothetical protein [Lachnospiraceae bacterium]